jgi:hypothetical protein
MLGRFIPPHLRVVDKCDGYILAPPRTIAATSGPAFEPASTAPESRLRTFLSTRRRPPRRSKYGNRHLNSPAQPNVCARGLRSTRAGARRRLRSIAPASETIVSSRPACCQGVAEAIRDRLGLHVAEQRATGVSWCEVSTIAPARRVASIMCSRPIAAQQFPSRV